MNTLDVFQQKKQEILFKIVHFFTNQETPADLSAFSEEIASISENDTAQIFHAFLEALEKDLKGDKEAAQDYLSIILPPLKQGGLPLSIAVRSVPSMFSIIAVSLGPEHLSWVARYAQEYTDALLDAWERA